MAFFTRVNLNVPILPPLDSPVDSNAPCGFPPASAAQHRRHSSEPVANPSVSTCTTSTSTEEAAATTNGVLKAAEDASVNELESDRNGKEEQNTDENNSGEPKRYEYTVDRVLGVEV